ncbi:nicotinamidase-related amidase [Edaphobacter lichenicola]|uniref:Nicotinamidase-related amidase n=1 Tax=Tunturiibacter lichenicola TaxID=2051959 RepID=A0A7W8N4E3_9BACT|nr:isochorismatase family protein [Edaphobacter lichenicola]MBB5345482.1 nicotinamidase-related amidase [Edaphobacter lichenicola]
MAITSLDPKTAPVIIDLQNGIVAMPTAHPVGEVVKQASALAGAFRRYDLPVVLVNVSAGAPRRTEQAPRVREFPAVWTDLVPELDQQPEEHAVTKPTWEAFTGTGLEEHLKKQGVRRLSSSASQPALVLSQLLARRTSAALMSPSPLTL